jgi:hypothetical protein
MLAQLEHQPTGEVRALPEDWWAGTFAIVDVQVERQEQRPDGSWPKEGDADFAKLTTLVNPFPGQLSLRELVLDAVTQDQGAEFVRRLQQFQQQIIQPPFYTLRGQPWTPPQPLKVSDQPAAGTDSGRPAELQARIEKNEQLIEALNGRIAAARAPRNPARSTTRPTAPGGELLPTDTASTRSPAGNTATDRLVESLQKQIAAKQAENLKLQDEYAQLTGKKAQIARTTIVAPTDEIRGEGDIGGSAPRSPFAPAARPGVPSDRVTTEQFRQGFQGGPAQDDQPAAKPVRLNLGPLVLNPQTSNMVNLWAIDLDTKPGHSYRYRVQVGVVNPLFNKPNLPKEQVQVHKAKFVLLSKPSEWSQPITLETLGHYFVINGSRAPAPGNVTFNVWRFYDGQWRSAEFRARPGDPIGGPGTGESSGINFDTRATLVDIDFDFPVPAKVGSLPQKTIRALVMQEDNILPRRRDIDSTDPKLDWLKTQRTQTTASQ